jgi:hypothetical protein
MVVDEELPPGLLATFTAGAGVNNATFALPSTKAGDKVLAAAGVTAAAVVPAVEVAASV